MLDQSCQMDDVEWQSRVLCHITPACMMVILDAAERIEKVQCHSHGLLETACIEIGTFTEAVVRFSK